MVIWKRLHKRKPVKGALKKDVKEGKGKITGKNGKSGKEEGGEKKDIEKEGREDIKRGYCCPILRPEFRPSS